MNDNLLLQIEMIENKIERLIIQRDFYLKLTENRINRSIDQNSTYKESLTHIPKERFSSNFKQ